MKKVLVTDEQLKSEMVMAEMIFGKGKSPSFEGELLAVNPTREEFATFNENFAYAVEIGEVPAGNVDGVVYYDAGAERAFIMSHNEVEIVEVNN